MLTAWGEVAAKLKAGEITPSQELSDLLLADLKEQ